MGMALFGGTSPYISLSLINWSGSNIFPFLYVMLICLIGLASVLIGKSYLSFGTVKSKFVETEA